ncbi:MAG: rRNA maturation RNase YbeY [Candidatus Yanofskybacteria bacterium RIFCSPHIGHO2_02_FULL_44_12b]|uniref:Endoribonuclease YbeY n=2 Tax=Candidatus Yanofskyibacteriota TaxID=1752733 RepID=A0A1F8GL80_9BACT|nr:MAG: putative rRNA maturation factor [Parcubacteria group bacterium GW2011_GWB1_35_5]KKT82346.1 MAG: putative rRNA maturation factor [Candidatus Yanofskybacteria bacterium GW2011_GWA2_44_9]OGN04852.1 MAG: rRNA maturation RNase YbeY [Candidatus Yanofskybacteria bacterium RIFCSPHIGHO2_01_FULL_44_24]OGN14074.1 MAG: rRNA maturation RNase YbeY [Candidatus Yanofskybacteria bacterium RIFCSPHIGHO2_02_FULL_44_12b]OGN25169.1 MAG: rRNA maturation RNase YbeY [Candidatus Yanofskybacteria bacterium RIFCSP
MLDLTFRNLTADKTLKKDFFENIIKAGMRELNMEGKHVGISVNLVGESKIKELNNKYRHKNKVTDVLSFPMSIGALQKLLTTNYLLHATDLGDIFIYPSFAKKAAKRENIAVETELARLVVHGFLHLAGYDHENHAAEAREMERLEQVILDRLSL